MKFYRILLATTLVAVTFLKNTVAQTIVDLAVADETFSTLVSLVQQAELVDTLNGPGPFTVFAPTNEAFAALPDSTVTWLTSEENRDALNQLLTYHVVEDNVMSSDLTAGDVATVEGQSFTVSLDPIMINNANVVSADIGASNGVIYVIDTVLIPDNVLPGEDATEAETPEEYANEYNGSQDYPINVVAQNYTDEEGVLLQGYLSIPPEQAEATSGLPAVVILHDGSGLDDYEMQRATMVARELGYVGFAADLFGVLTDVPQGWRDPRMMDFMAQFTRNMTFFANRIEAAVEHVKSLPEVDSERVAIAGYCFGGTGVLYYLNAGRNGASAGGVSIHPSLSADFPGPVTNVTIPALVLTGGNDFLTSPQAMQTLEDDMNQFGATWETVRYSGVNHAFSNWFSFENYDRNADERSWESMSSFLEVQFGQSNYSRTLPSQNVSAVNYTDGDFLLQGYLSLPDSDGASPAVVIIHDANGPDSYEQQRATELAQNHGYVALAADIFGYDAQVNPPESTRSLMTMYRDDVELFVSRIQAGIDFVKGLDEVDSSRIAIMGYCFGGTGVLSYALTGTDPDVRVITSYHGGLSRGLPDATILHIDGGEGLFSPLVIVESGGDDDAMTDIIELEETLMGASANYEISRYSGVQHAFTNPGDNRGRYNARAAIRSFDAMVSALETSFANIPGSATIVDVAVANSEFSTLVYLVQEAGLVETLSGPGPFTLFAPTNEAFDALPPSVTAFLTAAENRDALVEVLTYHVIADDVMSSNLAAGVQTVQGQFIAVSLDPLMINDEASVVAADIAASNGVIHVIDRVIVPDGVLPERNENLVELNWLAGFTDAAARVASFQRGNDILFSWEGFHDVQVLPSKEAFDACDFSEGINLGAQSPVTYTITETTYFACSVTGHCASGQKLEAIVSSDTAADATADAEAEIAQVSSTIFDVAVADENFSTLVSLIQQARLVDTLSGTGPFTLFAPTNEAFAALPDYTFTWLTSEENRDALVQVLTYHVVAGGVSSSDLAAGNVATVEGQSLNVSLDPVMINNANVFIADIEASNGVFHAINTVLIPNGLVPRLTIVDVAAADETFSTFVSLVQQAGLNDTLSRRGPFTLFAPTNEAFAALPDSAVTWLTLDWNREALAKVLMYHVVAGNVMLSDLRAGNTSTLGGRGQSITVFLGFPVIINNAYVITGSADVRASNGVIHAIDAVLIPDDVLLDEDVTQQTIADVAVADETFSTLVSLFRQAGLLNTLSGRGPFTLFAPTNEAFAALPDSVVTWLTSDENWEALDRVLTYHVVAGAVLSSNLTSGSVETEEGQSINVTLGSPYMINNANVVSADNITINGVIHVIDAVLIPDGVIPDEVLTQQTIVEVAVADETFSTLVSLVKQAGLVDTLSGPGPLTLFAPTNEAFATLPDSTVTWLTSEENREALAQVLTYHVVAGNVTSGDLTSGNIETVEGQSIIVSLGFPVMINNANFVSADVEASNGVIHVINTVLIPDGVLPEMDEDTPRPDEDTTEVNWDTEINGLLPSSSSYVKTTNVLLLIGTIFVCANIIIE